MKKVILSLLVGFAVAGCSNEEPRQEGGAEQEPEPIPGTEITDYYPAQVVIDIRDANGNALFSKDYHGIIDKNNLSESISYTYKGETKPLLETGYKNDYFAKSRYVMTTIYGVYVYYSNPADFPDAMPKILFGEFDGTEDHHETVAINWPDGSSNTIEFTSEARNAIPSMKVRVDGGKWVNTTNVTFVK